MSVTEEGGGWSARELSSVPRGADRRAHLQSGAATRVSFAQRGVQGRERGGKGASQGPRLPRAIPVRGPPAPPHLPQLQATIGTPNVANHHDSGRFTGSSDDSSRGPEGGAGAGAAPPPKQCPLGNQRGGARGELG